MTSQQLDESEISLRKLKKLVTVEVKVIDDSSISQIKLDEIFKTMEANMSGNQITLITGLLILCVTGYFTYSNVLEYKQKAYEMDLTQTYITRMADTIDKALNIIEHKDVQAPPRKLIDFM